MIATDSGYSKGVTVFIALGSSMDIPHGTPGLGAALADRGATLATGAALERQQQQRHCALKQTGDHHGSISQLE